MKAIRIRRASFVMVLIGLIGCSSIDEENKPDKATTLPQKVEQVRSLPYLSMMDLTGNKINLASFRGKKVLVNLWATWCPPCRREIPSIERLYKESDKEKAVFVLLSLDENFKAAKEFATSNKLHVPVFYPAEQLPDLFDVDAIPATYIFNEKGELMKEINSMNDYYTSEYIDLFK